MAEQAIEFQLRNGENTWATLRVEPDGRKLLCHQRKETELKNCPPLAAYLGNERLICQLAVREHGPCVELIDRNGNPRLQLIEDDDGELPEVIDPTGDARIAVAPQGPGSLSGPGSPSGQHIQKGQPALRLRLTRVKSDPRIMMGKPVIRNTRITVEHLLRKLAQGATEDDLLKEYPQLTREDVHEALSYAAGNLRDRDQPPSLFDHQPKS
jgi:uncharacterized protein (DUF433 family)